MFVIVLHGEARFSKLVTPTVVATQLRIRSAGACVYSVFHLLLSRFLALVIFSQEPKSKIK